MKQTHLKADTQSQGPRSLSSTITGQSGSAEREVARREHISLSSDHKNLNGVLIQAAQ